MPGETDVVCAEMVATTPSMRAPVVDEMRAHRSWIREEGGYLLEILALVGFAVVQPVLDPVGRSPETFVAYHANSGALVLFAAALALLPPLAVWLLLLATRVLGERVRRSAQAVVVGALAAVVALQAFVHVTSWRRRAVLALAAMVCGVAAGAARSRLGWFRSWLRYASPAPIVFAALFLFVSPASSLVYPDQPDVGTGAATSSSVVVVVFDEFALTTLLDGSGGIDQELFPNLAALADRSTWYRNATTVSPFTLEAVPSVFTGMIPPVLERPGLTSESLPGHTYADHPRTLFTLLGRSHVVNDHEWVTDLCPPDVCARRGRALAMARDLTRLALDVWWDATWSAGTSAGNDLTAEALLAGESRRARVEAFLDSLARHDRPSLDVLHVPLPHAEWDLLPSGQEYLGPGLRDGLADFKWATQDRADAYRMRYLLQAQYADALVGRLVERLEELGRFDESLVVITADHGVAFEEGRGHRDLDDGDEADLGWVPLLVKSPHQGAGVVDDGNVLLVDVLPTIARELDVTIPWTVDGVPAGTRTDDEKPVVANYLTSLSGVDDGVGRLDPSVFDDVLASGPSGMGTGPLRAWRSGRFGDLVGRRVAELPSGPPADVEITLDVPAGFADFDPSAAALELFVAGRIAPAGSADVVLAVDGVVAGWSETWESLGRPDEFGVVVAVPLLDAGRNEVDVYLVEKAGDRAVLRPVAAVHRS